MHNWIRKARVVLIFFFLYCLIDKSIALTFERKQIRIVGSASVYTLSISVAEWFGKMFSFKTPVVEATGTGGGIKIFCSGVGDRYPDIVNASRAMTSKERAYCAQNGVTDIIEVKIGHDGIIIGASNQAETFPLTLQDLYKALAEKVFEKGEWIKNPYQTWKEVNASLPNKKITVLGPTSTLASREVFEEMSIKKGCLEALSSHPQAKFCTGNLREDGGYIPAAEQENVIIQKLEMDDDALGVFSFNFLGPNHDKVQEFPIEGVKPTFETIAMAHYPLSRPLFFYVKSAHVRFIPGIIEYVMTFLSDQMIEYLSEKGLVPLSPKELNYQRTHVTQQLKVITHKISSRL